MTIYNNNKPENYSDYIIRLYNNDRTIKNKILSVKNITFQVTDNCSLRCKYCYQHNKGNKRMSFETAKKFINLILNGDKGFKEYLNSDNTIALILDFIGGEPLLEPELINNIVSYFRQEAIKIKHPWATNFKISISSNGVSYFEPEVQKLLNKYKDIISLNITIDGNKELHDSCRVFPDGVTGSYDYAIAAAKDWTSKGNYLGSKLTIAPENLKYLYSAIVHMISLGYNSIFANTIFEKGWNKEHATEFYYQLKNISDYMIDNDLYKDIYCSLFESSFFHSLPESDDRNWCGGTGSMLACDPDGRLFPCIRYMESSLNGKQEPLFIGDIENGIAQDDKCKNCVKMLNSITRKSQSTDECFNCPIAFGCAWCSAYNYEEFGTPNKRATYICDMHKARSLANSYYWNKIYKRNNQKERFKIYCPKDWAIKIIPEDEFNMLKELEK